jgi:hypothetical protein
MAKVFRKIMQKQRSGSKKPLYKVMLMHNSTWELYIPKVKMIRVKAFPLMKN